MALSARLVDADFGGGSLVVSTAGVAADELLTACIDTDGGGDPGTVTGWTQQATASAAGADSAWVYVKDSLGPGDATYTFTIGGGADGAVHLVAVAASSGTVQFDDAGATGVASGTSTNMVAPSVDAAEATALLVNFWMLWSGTSAGSITAPGGMDEIISNVRSNGWGHRSIYTEEVGSGATGTRTATASSTFGHVSSSAVFSEVGGGEARAMAGTADSISDAAGVLATQMPLAGTTESASSATGTLQSTLELEATTDSINDASATLAVGLLLAGVADSASNATGAIEAETSLAGITDSAGSATGLLFISGQVDLVGVTDSITSASGALSGELALAGVTDSASSGSGTLSIAGLVELEGATLEAGGASGSMSGTIWLEGAADATDGATGQLGVSGEVKRDTMVLPIAQSLLACLCEAVAEAPNPPASCCLRPGVTVAQGVSEREDECCEGLAWVRVSRVFPTGSEIGFPAINNDPNACSPPSYGIEMEMGIYRCAPTGDERNLPTCNEWTATTEQILDDAASMRRAWCCFRDNYDNSAKLVGEWTPVTVQGGCTGGTMTIMIESYCSDCIAGGS